MQHKLTSRQISKIIQHINASVPSPPTVSNTFYSKPKDISDITRIQEVSDHMGFFLGLLQSVKVITRTKERDVFVVSGDGNATKQDDTADYSGLYKVSRTGQINIEVVSDSGFYFKHYLAVIAHEMTHHYLFHHSIKANGFDKEIYTDVAAIYLGFGPIIIEGYEPCKWAYGSVSHDFQLGYIDVPTAKKALIISAKLRGWRGGEIITQLKGFDKLFFKLKNIFIK